MSRQRKPERITTPTAPTMPSCCACSSWSTENYLYFTSYLKSLLLKITPHSWFKYQNLLTKVFSSNKDFFFFKCHLELSSLPLNSEQDEFSSRHNTQVSCRLCTYEKYAQSTLKDENFRTGQQISSAPGVNPPSEGT